MGENEDRKHNKVFSYKKKLKFYYIFEQKLRKIFIIFSISDTTLKDVIGEELSSSCKQLKILYELGLK